MDPVSEIPNPESKLDSPQIYYQFAWHHGGNDNARNVASQIASEGQNIDSHLWNSRGLLTRLKEIGPKVITIDGSFAGSTLVPSGEETLSERIQKIKKESRGFGPWLWYIQPERPSKYSAIDINTEGKDYLLNISAEIPDAREDIFKYLISNQNIFSSFLDKYNSSSYSNYTTDVIFNQDTPLGNKLKMLVYSSAFLSGMITGSMPEIKHRQITRRSFLRGLGAGMGALTLSRLLSNPMDNLDHRYANNVIANLEQAVANSRSLEESIEIQKKLGESYKLLKEEQVPKMERVSARTAIMRIKLAEALERLHSNGRPWEDLSPAVVLLGNGHALESEAITNSNEEAIRLVQRYGKHLVGGINNLNELLGNSKSDILRNLTMTPDQTRDLQEAVIGLISYTGVERVYDPMSITIRDEFSNIGKNESRNEFKTIGNDKLYKPYELLIQSEQSFESQSIKDILLPFVNE